MVVTLRDELELRQSLVVVEPDGSAAEVSPQAQQPPPPLPMTAAGASPLTLEIRAPATLPEGYTLPVQHNGRKFVVLVPAGGVEANQVFRVQVVDQETGSGAMMHAHHPHHRHTDELPPLTLHNKHPSESPSGPVGHWKDGLLDIFKYGVCHPHAVTSLACSLLAAGQVIQRLKFTWHGVPAANSAESARAFDIIFYITLFHWFMIVTMWLVLSTFDTTTDYMLPPDLREPHHGWLLVLIILFNFFKYAYFGLNLYVIYRLRISIRHQSAIPGTDLQDACQTIWCPCLAIAQLLRHTTSYDHVPARYCTRTGLLEDDGDDDLI